MPLIFKIDRHHPAANYSDIRSPALIEKDQTEQSPLLREKVKARHREFRREVSRRIRRHLRMKRAPLLMLILIEVFERFAYYGILINFVLFLYKCCGWPMFVSVASVMVFVSLSWFMCAVSGIMADSRFGRYNTIVSGFLIYFIGTLTLVVVAFLMGHYDLGKREEDSIIIQPWILMILLVSSLSITAGEGAVKSNLSTFGADQLKRDAPHPNSKTLFNCFYWMSNVISLLCLAGVTYIQQMKWDFALTVGFGLPMLSLTLAFVTFLCCRKYFTIDRPHGTGIRNMWLILCQAWSRRNAVKVETRELFPRCHSGNVDVLTCKGGWLDKATISCGGTFLESEVDEVRSIRKVVIFSTLLIPYWMIYSQLYSTFILQGLHLNTEYGGINVPAAWPCLFEILILLILVPAMERGVFSCLAKRGVIVPITLKIVLGMLFAAGSAGLAGHVARGMTRSFLDTGSVNFAICNQSYAVVRNYPIWWQIPQYVLMGISEVFTSIPGLQMVFSMCPSTPQSVTSAVYNLMISAGSLLSLVILALTAYQFGWFPRAEDEIYEHYLGNESVAYYYWLLAGVMLVTAFGTLIIGFYSDIWVLNRHEKKRHRLVNRNLPQERPPSVETVTAQTRDFVELS